MSTSTASLHDVTWPVIRTHLPGPKAAVWIARDDQVLSPSYTRAYPLVAKSGLGCTIQDVDGNLFLDFTAGIAVTATGHAHPEVVSAIVDQATSLLHMSGTDFYYAAEIELAERLARIAPGTDAKRVFFTNSGTEAVEAALKLARHHTGRHRFIACHGAFHGRTFGALSVSGSKAVHLRGFGPFLGDVHRIAFNAAEAAIEQLFRTSCPPDEVAAIIVEPIQGEGGYRPAEPHFLPLLRSVCDRHGILLVADEVQSGVGRTGKWFACEHYGVTPDILCLAKGIASGLPLGAMIASADLMDWPSGSHASTFGGNPLSCRAALATLDLIERQYMANARERGSQLRQALAELEQNHPCLTGTRGMGLMVAIDVVDGGKPDPERRDAIIEAAFQRGLLLLGCGQTSIRFCPALCVTQEQVSAAISLFAKACQA